MPGGWEISTLAGFDREYLVSDVALGGLSIEIASSLYLDSKSLS